MIVINTVIHTDNEFVHLWDLINENTGLYYETPSLEFVRGSKKELWDNSNFVYALFKNLKKGNKSSHVKELKKYCKEENFNYADIEEELLEIYKISKNLGWWKKYKKKNEKV